MLLTITTTHHPATDLGYLLHKHPERHQTLTLSAGAAHVFYPVATPQRCTAALLIELDPVTLSRGHGGAPTNAPLEPYVNDRPYVATSLLSGAIREAYGTAMTGRSKERQALADTAIPLTAHLPVIPSRGGPDLATRLFGPLGYTVEAQSIALDDEHPGWGASPYVTLTLTHTVRLRDLLAHLYVLIPVLDDQKHYFVDESELDKLQRHGSGWLETHPERELIVRRALKHQRSLRAAANALLNEPAGPEAAQAHPARLNDLRLDAVAQELAASGASSVLDLGCGEGKLLRRLARERQYTRIVGMDVSPRAVSRALQALERDALPAPLRDRMTVLQGSLTYADTRLRGFDAAALVEVVEHLDQHRLWALERSVFRHAAPGTVIVTTPNAEYNAVFEFLPGGEFRHADHRFEWTRAQFLAWAERVAHVHGYTVTLKPVGEAHPTHGPPTQMAVFTRGTP